MVSIVAARCLKRVNVEEVSATFNNNYRSYGELKVSKEYVEQHGSSYRIIGSRVWLESIVYEFLNRQSPEGIQENFPTLTLEQV
jgi:hypothetical protein